MKLKIAVFLLLTALETVRSLVIGGGGGSSVRFDGIGSEKRRDSFIVISDVHFGTHDNFTIEFWGSACTTADRQTWISYANENGLTFEINFLNGMLNFIYEGHSWSRVSLFTEPSHFALSIERVSSMESNITGYYNGEKYQDTVPYVVQIENDIDGKWYIGIHTARKYLAHVQENALCGFMDEIRFWDGVRSQQDIQYDMFFLLDPLDIKNENLRAYLTFDEQDSVMPKNLLSTAPLVVMGHGSLEESPEIENSLFPLFGGVLRVRGKERKDIIITLRGRKYQCIENCESSDILADIMSLPVNGNIKQHSQDDEYITMVPFRIQSEDRVVLYHPEPDLRNFTDSFEYRVCDKDGCSKNYNVEITVELNKSPLAGHANMLHLNGNNDFVILSDFLLQDSWTIEMHVQFHSGRNDQTLISKRNTFEKTLFNFGISQNQYCVNIRGTAFTKDPRLTVPHHVALTCIGISTAWQTNCVFYINGAIIWIHTFNSYLGNTIGPPWSIGRNCLKSEHQTSSVFGGNIDELRIWNIVRTQEQIQMTMYSLLTSFELTLVIYLRFDEAINLGVANLAQTSYRSISLKESDGIYSREYPSKATFVGDAKLVRSVFPLRGSDIDVVMAPWTSFVVPLVGHDNDDENNTLIYHLLTLGHRVKVSQADGTPIETVPSTLIDFSIIISTFNYSEYLLTSLELVACDYLSCSEPISVVVTVPVAAPRITAFIANDPHDHHDVFGAEDTLTIIFDVPTNMVPVDMQTEVDALFIFFPPLEAQYYGQWMDPSTCVVTILNVGKTSRPPVVGEFKVQVKPSGGLTDAARHSLVSASISPVLSGNWGIESTNSIAMIFSASAALILLTLMIVISIIFVRKHISKTQEHSLSWKINYVDISLLDLIGVGSFGLVYRCVYRGSLVAIKMLKDIKIMSETERLLARDKDINSLTIYMAVKSVLTKHAKDRINSLLPKFLRSRSTSKHILKVQSAFFREIEVMVNLRHPNVVLFMGAVIENPHYAIVQELMEGSIAQLFDEVTFRMTWHLRRSMALQTASGLNYLHSHVPPILHLDLKSLNILYDIPRTTFKIADFGLSALQETSSAGRKGIDSAGIGSILWMAPEMLSSKPSRSPSVDVYAFGMVLLEISNRALPWHELSHESLGMYSIISKITNEERPYLHPDVSSEWRELIESCSSQLQEDRPSMGVIMRKLENLDVMNWKPVLETKDF